MPSIQSIRPVRPENTGRLLGFFCLVLLGLIGIFGSVPTSAEASPPAVDQYVEQIPSGGGERPAGGGGDSAAGSPAGPYLGPLASAGADGARAAAILGALEAGNPAGKGTKGAGPETDEGSLDKILSASDLGGSGAGLALPISMLAIVILGLLVRQLGRAPQAGGSSAGD